MCVPSAIHSRFSPVRVYIPARFGHAAAYPVQLFYYVRNFSVDFPRAHPQTYTYTYVQIYCTYHPLERVSFIVVVVNVDRWGNPVNWNVAPSIKLLK